MNTLILQSKNKTDLKIFLELANRIGVQSKMLSDEEILDAGLLSAMLEAKKTKIVPQSQIMKSLKRNESNV
ncbi:MAG: hypothetical protein M0R02_03670 [Bacteroidales bacterium]|nr:hypothetical protein [Bacteroidales bacterium]NLK80583.1 hypothetical protein [Bacteroidales bacterium]HPY81752.1 hypothetical protein [Bacteroidales bacterium]